MARIPLIGSYAVGDFSFSTVADRHEEAVLAKGEWVAHRHNSGKIYALLSYRGRRHAATVYQARFIWELENGPISPGMEVDHIDPDQTLNNDVDTNLRLATNAQNKQNKKRQSNSTSGYKGVSWHKQHQKWLVRVKDNGKLMHFGLWDDVILAARFYDVTVLQLWGDRAQTNFPRSDYPVYLW